MNKSLLVNKPSLIEYLSNQQTIRIHMEVGLQNSVWYLCIVGQEVKGIKVAK